MGKLEMTSKYQLIKILNDAIRLNANNLHFTLADNDNVLIQLRSANILLPYSHVKLERYKQILDYIEIHTKFEPFHKGQPQTGIMTVNDFQSVLECSVSILPTTKFKSLVLRIKNPHIKNKTKEQNLKKTLELLASSFLND